MLRRKWKDVGKGIKEIHDFKFTHKDGHYVWTMISTNPLFDEKDGFIGVLGMLNDITERKMAKDALKESEEKYRTLFESDPDYTILLGMDGVLLDVNHAAVQVTGLSKDEFIGKNFKDLKIFPEDDLNLHKDKYSRLFAGEYVAPYESRIYDRNGKIRWVQTILTVIKKEETPDLVLIINSDIDKRKKDEDKIKASLEEKEILLKEIHHRVKNNLQIISSLLDLQKGYIKDNQPAVNVLTESQNRVLSMAMIHEMIYQSEDLNQINISEYIRSLISNLFHSYGGQSTITSLLTVEQIYLNIETAIPLGLIITELITNSLKYAFPKDKNGEIAVNLTNKDGKYELIISDNGVGMPDEINFNTVTTLGLRLVKSLSNQLDGKIKIDKANGTQYNIIFKELVYKQRI